MKHENITIRDQLLYYLEIGKLKTIISYVDPLNTRLYSLDDLMYKEWVKEEWQKFPDKFLAKSYHLKPNIPKGCIFAGCSGDIFIRYNEYRTSELEFNRGKKYDVVNLIFRNGNYLGEDGIVSIHQNLWEEEWEEYVLGLCDEDPDEYYPHIIVENLTDDQLDMIYKNPPFGKTEKEIKQIILN